MLGTMLSIKVLKSNRFKVVVWGRNDDHIMDWHGCNFHVKTVEGQPHRGYETFEEAVSFAREKFLTRDDVHSYGRRCGDGSFLGDNPSFEMICLTFDQMGKPKNWGEAKS